jgi:rhodanese-related sulfurtransferase
MATIVDKPLRNSLRRRGSRSWIAAIALLVAAALATQGCSTLRRRAAERPPYRKVTPPIAYEIMRDAGNLMILDLRPRSAFHSDTGHIYRAYNLPAEQLPFRLVELTSFREDTFLVYCDTRECADQGMEVLVSSGFENAILIDGGIDGWIASGFPTVLPADLAGKPQTEAGRPGEAEAETTGEEIPPPPAGGPAAQPALQQAIAGAPLPAICPEPHVQVEKPPE